MKFTIILLLFPLLTVGQISISGKVINYRTKEAIAFATVGLLKENIGTNALEDGSFQLSLSRTKFNDTLIFSCVGFTTLKLPVDNFKTSNIIIELSEQQTILNEVIVTNKSSWTSETLNDFSKCGNSFVTSSGYQTQLAQHFQAPKDNSILQEIKICRFSVPLVATEKTIFRIRIYDIDTLKKSPSSDLCDQIIEVKTRSKTISVNLEKYKIYIPNKDFFVAIEWLKIPFNESKSKTKVNGKNVEHITYRPSIGWTDNVNTKMEAWMLDYKNNWRPMFKMNYKTSISISATVKY
jgi:CarboxypepD_reg-like domain